MTDDTTTIEITEAQRDELKELKAHDRESYKAVMDRLLNGKVDDHTVELGDLQDAFGIPDEVIPDDLDDRLDRIESATKEATNAAQSADRKLENMGNRR